MIHSKPVLLINIPEADYWDHREKPALGIPLGLLSIAGYLAANGFRVRLVDGGVDRTFTEDIANILIRDPPLWIGISSMTAGLENAKSVACACRETNPAIPLIWGGVHTTLFPAAIASSPLADAAVVGDGEFASLAISQALATGMNDLSNIPQVGTKKRPSPPFPAEFMDLDKLPFPDYSCIEPSRYWQRDLSSLGIGIGQARVWVVNTGRGCPCRCSFCINTHPSQRWRMKSAQRLIAEISDIVKNFDPAVLHIQDDLFFCDAKRIRAFRDAYDQYKWHFSFFSLAFANHFNDSFINRDLISWLDGKALWIGMGIESGCPQIRQKLNKSITNDQILRAVSSTQGTRIRLGLAFMTGLPIESRADRFTTIAFILDLVRRFKGISIAYQAWRPYPGSELYEKGKTKGFKEPAGIDEWIAIRDRVHGFYNPLKLPWNNPNELLFYMALISAWEKAPRSTAHRICWLALWCAFRIRAATGNRLPFYEGLLIRCLLPLFRRIGIAARM